MVGSDSDLKQCLAGLLWLQEQEKAEVVCVITASIHRNTENVLLFLREWTSKMDVWVIGAGWANHLTGTCAAYLRNAMRDNETPVVGVAFQDLSTEDTEVAARHDQAAVLSITEVPGSSVIFHGYVGSQGFCEACEVACNLSAGTVADLKPPKPTHIRSHIDAIKVAQAA